MGEPTVVGLHVLGSQLQRARLRGAGSAIEILGLDSESLDGSDAAVAAGEANSAVCIASMPASDVMTRCWTMPPADDERFKKMVANRLEADLPVATDQVVWGYRRGTSAVSGETTSCVLAQAVRSERVAEYLASLEARGVRVDALTTEAEALAALCSYGFKLPKSAGIEALVLATEAEWLVAVRSNGVIRSVRRVATGSRDSERFYQEFRQCLEAEHPAHEYRRILWYSTPGIEHVREVLSDKLKLAAEPIEPIEGLLTSAGERVSADRLIQYAPAIGLGLAGIFEKDRIIRFAGREEHQLTPRQERFERIVAQRWRLTGAAAGLLVLAAVIHLSAIGCESAKMQTLLDDYDQGSSPMATLEPKIRAMNRLEKYRIDVESLMAEMCLSIPDSMIMSSVQLSRDHGLVIKGTAKSPKDIFKLAEDLRKGDRFTEVQPGRTDPKGGFTISAQLAGVETLSTVGKRGGGWR